MSTDESTTDRVSVETLGDDAKMITLVVSPAEHRLLLAALDQKIWALNQSGTAGAYKNVPAYRVLRAEIADLQPVDPEAHHLHYLKLPE